MSFLRIWAIASNGFREVIRDRILYFMGFFVLILAIAKQVLPQISANHQDKIFLDFGLGMIGFLSAIVAIFIGTGLINKEIEKRTVLVLIPKPISRSEFIIGKHLGLFGVLAVMVTAMMLIYLGFLGLSGIYFPLISLLVSFLYLFIELALLVAVAILFGVFTSSTLATLLAFSTYLMGHFSQYLVELGKLSENANLEFMFQILYLVLPDLSRLNLRNEAVYGLLPNFTDLLINGLYGIIYTVLVLAIAILIFWEKEF